MIVGIAPIVPTAPGAEIVRTVPIVRTVAIARMRTGLLAAVIQVVEAEVRGLMVLWRMGGEWTMSRYSAKC